MNTNKEKLMYDMIADVYAVCTKETCYPATAHLWTEENRFFGHCAIVTYLMQQQLGGDIIRGMIKEQGISHYWNFINDKNYDFTKSQFETPVTLTDAAKVNADRIINNADTVNRYNQLVNNLINLHKSTDNTNSDKYQHLIINTATL